MPLLNGTFDPLRFNSTTLAVKMYEAEAGDDDKRNFGDQGVPKFGELDEKLQHEYIDTAQQIIDSLVADGVFSVEPAQWPSVAGSADSDSIPIPQDGPQ